eukprot:2952490-Prymnesium_polylepis.2
MGCACIGMAIGCPMGCACIGMTIGCPMGCACIGIAIGCPDMGCAGYPAPAKAPAAAPSGCSRRA